MSDGAGDHGPRHMDRAAWEAGRNDYLGASDAGAVLGVNPWRTPLDVWADKLGITPRRPPTIGTELGHTVERFAAELWLASNDHGATRIEPVGLGTLAHPERPHIRATPDMIAFDETGAIGLVECKLVGHRVAPHWRDDDGPRPPLYVVAQAVVQMAVANLPWVAISAIHGDGWRHEVHYVERDLAVEAAVLDRLDAWWATHIVEGKRPDLDGRPDLVRRVLDHLHPRPAGAGAIIDASPDLVDLCRRHGELKQISKRVDADLDAVANEIRAALGNATDAHIPGETKPIVTYRAQTRSSIDAKALRAAHPDIAAEFTVSTSYSVLNVRS